MEKVEMFRHIFEAFSSLSDAQDLIASRAPSRANAQINHAKMHLDAIAQSDPDLWREAMLSLPITCSLAKDSTA